MRFVCKSSVTSGDGVFKAGETIELSEEQAAQLLAAGVIEPVKAPPASPPPHAPPVPVSEPKKFSK